MKCDYCKGIAINRVSFLQHPHIIVPVINFICGSCLEGLKKNPKYDAVTKLPISEFRYTNEDCERNEAIREQKGKEWDAHTHNQASTK